MIRKRFIIIIVGVILGAICLKFIEAPLSYLVFAIIFTLTFLAYRYYKEKELGILEDEREQYFYLLSFKYTFAIVSIIFLLLFYLREFNIIQVSKGYYLGFFTAYFLFLCIHFLIYKLLLWLNAR